MNNQILGVKGLTASQLLYKHRHAYMQELLFRLGGEMGQFVYLMLSFLSSKRA